MREIISFLIPPCALVGFLFWFLVFFSCFMSSRNCLFHPLMLMTNKKQKRVSKQRKHLKGNEKVKKGGKLHNLRAETVFLSFNNRVIRERDSVC